MAGISLRDAVRASAIEDEGKADVQLTSRQYHLGFSDDPQTGQVVFWISPRSLFENERFQFTPFSFTQFCNKVLVYPAKYMTTDLLSPANIRDIAEERQRRMRERKMVMKIKKHANGRIVLRGIVRPNRTYISTTALLTALEELAPGYELAIRGEFNLPDHEFQLQLDMGDGVIVGTEDRTHTISFVLGVHNSEVGALKGGLKIHGMLYDDYTQAVINIRPNLFRIDPDYKEQDALNGAVEEILDDLQRERNEILDNYMHAWLEDEMCMEQVVVLYKLLGIDPPTIEKLKVRLEAEVNYEGASLSKGLMAGTLAAYAATDPRKRDLEVLAGRIINGA